MHNTHEIKIMPREIRDACEWVARQQLGDEASQLAVATWVKYMSKTEVRQARHEHAYEAAAFDPWRGEQEYGL